jgi:hypothetical protein
MLNYQRVINYIINHTTGGLPKTSKIRAKFLSTLENCLAKMDIDPIAHSGPATRMILKKILKDRLHAAEKKRDDFLWIYRVKLDLGAMAFRMACEIFDVRSLPRKRNKIHKPVKRRWAPTDGESSQLYGGFLP